MLINELLGFLKLWHWVLIIKKENIREQSVYLPIIILSTSHNYHFTSILELN